MPAIPESLPAPGAEADLLMPLLFFYGRHERDLPSIEFIHGDEMPEPWRHLLVHASDMTPRLRAWHQSPIGLKVMEVEKSEDYVMRKVILHREDTGRPVEYGAIGIDVSGFPAHVKELIRSGSAPLGGILETESIAHQSSPRGYFRVVADEVVARLLQIEPGVTLYGRSNVLTFPDGIVFADIVEILPDPA